MSDSSVLRFAGFELDEPRQELRLGAEPVQLDPKPFQLLVYLVRNRDRAVSKDEIFDEVWPDVVVSESALSSALKDLRRALGDDGTTQRFVRTLRGRGYRFVAPVDDAGAPEGGNGSAAPRPPDEPPAPVPTAPRARRPVAALAAVAVVVAAVGVALALRAGPGDGPSATAPAPASANGAPEARTRSSIAVLPFVNLSDDSDQTYFSDGVAEELLNLLARTPGLRVAARTSSFAFRDQTRDVREIGEELGVETVLEGSVRRAGDRLRIAAQLIDVETGYHLWSEIYDRQLVDVFTVQEEISGAIASALRLHLGPEGGSTARVQRVDLDAYDLYLLGRHYIEKRSGADIEEALQHFDRALAIDPDYALAHSGKATSLLLLTRGHYGDLETEEAGRRALPHINRALELAPDLAEAHATRGLYLIGLDDMDAASAELDRAVELNPNLANAHVWRSIVQGKQGDPRGALESSEQAVRLDPMSYPASFNLAGSVAAFGDVDRALEILDRFEQRRPESAPMLALKRAELALGRGQLAKGYELARGAADARPGTKHPRTMLALALIQLGDVDGAVETAEPEQRALMLALVGRSDDAREAFAQLGSGSPEKERDRRFALAVGHLRMGRTGTALPVLEELMSSGAPPSFPYDEGLSPSPLYLVAARRAAGADPGDSAARLDRWAEDLAEWRTSGVVGGLPGLEARLHALRDQDDAALAALERALARGELPYWDRDDPCFAGLADDPRFRELFDRVDAHVDAERAKLGWPNLTKS